MTLSQTFICLCEQGASLLYYARTSDAKSNVLARLCLQSLTWSDFLFNTEDCSDCALCSVSSFIGDGQTWTCAHAICGVVLVSGCVLVFAWWGCGVGARNIRYLVQSPCCRKFPGSLTRPLSKGIDSCGALGMEPLGWRSPVRFESFQI